MFAVEGDLLDEAVLDSVVTEVGLEVEAFRTLMDSDAAYARVAADVALISDVSLAVSSSVINGLWVLGAIGPIERQLDAEAPALDIDVSFVSFMA